MDGNKNEAYYIKSIYLFIYLNYIKIFNNGSRKDFKF